MYDFIEAKLKRAAVSLAETPDYDRAAATLQIPVSELRQQISELENILCLYLFHPGSDPPAITSDGNFLAEAFRKALSLSEPTEIDEMGMK